MDMNENEIENITILKDASATSMYGGQRCKWSDRDYNESLYSWKFEDYVPRTCKYSNPSLLALYDN